MSESAGRRGFVLARIQSLAATIPLGAFLFVHFSLNSSALAGRESFTRVMAVKHAHPALLWLEILVIYLPLALHSAFGLSRSLRADHNIRRLPNASNWAYTLQHVSGVIVLMFVALHVWQLRLPLLTGEGAPEDTYQRLVASLSATRAGVPVAASLYLVGIAATTYHFSNGLRTFSLTWGLFESDRSYDRWAALCSAIGILLFLVGLNLVLDLATGAPLFPIAWSAP